MMRVTNRSAEEPSTMSTLRRMQTLNRILSSPKNMNRMSRETIKLNYTCSIFCRHKSTVESGIVTIGNVKKLIRDPSRPEYVPVQYLDKQPSQKILSDLKWMLQKDNLGQDIFLIGRPGRSRRILALMYSELTQKEVEFVSLSRDTTEADLKQRREIVGGSAQYLNQSAVRAAVEGRILILEGIEKAERNVLPVLNNLLENREMHLEDGRFLMAPKSYDKLIKDHGEEYLAKSNLIRVHEEFRVIALGLAVPNYIGNPLDPPLRSRFQARDVDIVPYKEMESLLFDANPSIDAVKLKQILSCGYALLSTESKSIELPDFPIDNLVLAAKILNLDPSTEIGVLFRMLYPYTIIAGKDGQSAVSSILQSFKVTESPSNAYPEIQTTNKNNLDSNKCLIRTSDHITLELKTGNSNVEKESRFVPLPYHNHVLINLLRAHAADSDFCIVGPSGCGKTEIVKRFSELLDYDVVPIVLYQDITSRDLIQRRDTTENGDTVWKYSPLISAALEGKIALLDGVHRVHASTLSILHRLMVDREIQLHDGQRLIRHDRYDYLAAKYGVERLTSSNIHRIHPSFRIIAMAEPPGGYNSQWLTSEMLTFFPINDMRSLNHLEEIQLIEALTGQVDSRMKVVLNVVNKLRSSKDAAIASAASSLTTRMLIRIAKRLSYFPNHDVYEIVQQACLAKFLPPLTRKALNTILHKSGIHPTSAESSSSMTSYSVDDEKLTIGDTVIPRYRPTQASSHKIPDVLFYDSPQHINLLKNLLQDFTIGEHLLLVGNQGVGKNKLTDRMLQLLNRPREYIQLHRDTTVQSLTVQPTVVDGCVKYEDSPLVRAVREGNVLVIDEADKAPIHVTCILGTLVEAGEMILSDGRMIVPSWNQSTESNVIKMHPDFRIILISNRPGFPFLGNNLFGVLGDLFSCHVIDNPRPESEIQLLRQYGPNVDDDTLKRVLRLFQDLRELADNGLLLYPYSTREAVNVVKHLQAYPTDGLAEAVSNVFDFDRYSVDMKSILVRVLHEHEIPIELVGAKQRTGDEHLQLTIERESGLDVSGPKHGKIDETGNPHVGGNTWAGGTGGRDTAGLGGKGGPYRLDAGHNVHQLSDEEKNAIPEHVKKAAREMGIKAFKNRLKEIQMSEYDAKVYNEYSLPVQNQVQALRIVLSSLQARTKERQWMRHQTTGELDDTKLVEGVTGERAIYRRRADVEPELGAPQIKPKRLKLVVDVSGSMYRFNGFDGRLDREMEAVIMVMEAFQGFENKIQYDIVGHSGESDCINFVNKNNPPIDNKQRLDVIKTMHAHAQFCISGDYTLEAIQNAIRSLEKEQNEFDEGIIIALSDANLSRYGISPYRLSDTLQLSDIVGAYAIFIGSLGDQAVRLTNALPAGRGFVCMNLENIPQIIQQIFAASLFKS